MTRFQKKALGLGLGMTLLLAGAYGAAVRFFPLELSALSHRFEFWRAGISSLSMAVAGTSAPESARIQGFERNLCSPAAGVKQAAPGRECVCMLLLHGSGDQSTTWRKILLEPRESWRVPVRLVAVDVPGAGMSWSPEEARDLTARRLSDITLQSVLAHVPRSECRAWMVVGNSHGGWMAAWAAVDHRERVNKLVLVDAAGLASQVDSTREVGALFDGSVEGLKEFQKRAYHAPRALPDPVWSAAADRLKKARELLPKGALELMLTQERLDTYLASIRANTLVVWGKSDRITPPEGGREFARLIPGAQLREAPDCGHMPQKECPAALMKALNEWVIYGAM